MFPSNVYVVHTHMHTHIFEKQIELTFHKLYDSVTLYSNVSIKQFRTIHSHVSNYVKYILVFIFILFLIELNDFIKIALLLFLVLGKGHVFTI